MNGANARAGEHGIGRLGDHRHINRNTITLTNTLLFQHIGEAAYFFMKLAICDFRCLIRLVTFPDNRNIFAPRDKMAIDAIDAGIERAVFIPFYGHVFLAVQCVFDLCVRAHPVNAFAVFAPKSLGVA